MKKLWNVLLLLYCYEVIPWPWKLIEELLKALEFQRVKFHGYQVRVAGQQASSPAARASAESLHPDLHT